MHGVDSTELPVEVNYPLCTVTVKGKKYAYIPISTVTVENVGTKETNRIMLSVTGCIP